MSDYKRFLKLYKSIGIDENRFELTVAKDGGLELCLRAEYNGNIVGYGGFCTIIEFDKKGNFLRQGFWE